MTSKKLEFKLTKRDMDIMMILWDSSVPLTASEVVQKNSELTINTVQAVLRKLLKKELIEVADIVYSNTVLCRSYKASISKDNFAISKFAHEFKDLSESIPATSLVAAFLDLEQDTEQAKKEITSLELLLREYKEQLND